MDAITYGSLFLILGSTRLSVLTCCISENPGKHGFLSADAETQEELRIIFCTRKMVISDYL